MMVLTDVAAAELDGLEEYAIGLMDRWKVPGMSIAVTQGGNVIFMKGFGFRDQAGERPVTTQTIFAIGSSTKAFTTMVLATLVDEGKLDWDTPVRAYLPWFKMYDPFTSERMTARDLVTHRSGLPRYDLLWYNNLSSTREEIVRRLRYLPPSGDFRTIFQYQNLMFLTAGYLAGVLDGGGWETAVKTRILDPLGMSATNFSVEDSKATSDYALPYSEKDDRVREVGFRNIDLIGPAGSINAHVEDMVKWLLLHQKKGDWRGRQLVSATQMSEMHKPQMAMPAPYMPLPQTAHGSYGLGWFVRILQR